MARHTARGDPARAIRARLGAAIRRGRPHIWGVKILRTMRSGWRHCVPRKTRFGFGGSKGGPETDSIFPDCVFVPLKEYVGQIIFQKFSV